MNHKMSFTCGIMLLLMVTLAACATTKVDPCPTSEPQACPTAAPQVMPPSNAYRWGLTSESNAIITFEPGEQCNLQVINPVAAIDGGIAYDVVAKDQAHQNYAVFVEYLDPGKTLEDLKKHSYSTTKPPDFVHIIAGLVTTPMSGAMSFAGVTISLEQGPIYFTCMVEGPDELRIIGHVGPLEVQE